jgi:hypothetical protein
MIVNDLYCSCTKELSIRSHAPSRYHGQYVVTTPRCTLHLCANEATDHAVEAASEELIVFSLYFLQLPNNSELKQLLLGLFRQL